MDIPRFDQHLNTSSSPGDLGDAFQVFVHELLLSDYPDLHPFQSRGKDGGIDLARTTAEPRNVVECKYIGKDGLEEARARWNKVTSNFRTHLAAPDGPTLHQSQYGPWYRSDPAIREYVFCVSSELGNLEQIDKLRQEIADFFQELSASHSHLAHLSGLTVRVLDWNDIKTLLLKRPHLIFRWFKVTRHYGLVTLDEVTDYSTFRSYLFSDKLPYYARGQHLSAMPAPQGVEITDEKGMLDQVGGGNLTGLVVTGSGGVGKTRLTLEIGRLAQDEGWVVLRVLRRLKENALEHLARRVTPETRVLLLIDYVETQRDFMELIETLNDLNDSAGLHLRYVANCRTSYYQTIAATSRHREINLSPAFDVEAVRQWFESYQHQTVHHILECSGIKVTESHLTVCRDVPVLAVFVSYLHGAGRELELKQLLEEEDFTRWLVKRLQLSFGDATVSRSLAQLVALFPMQPDAIHRPELIEHRELFDRLATDGWIEKLPADETRESEVWVTAHDVLADRILLSYFDSIPHTVEDFVLDLLSLARRVGSLRSALITLQRLVDRPALKSLDWPTILDRSIAEDPPAWRDVRDILVRTSLLSYGQIITLLGQHEEVWQGAEEKSGFHLDIGWLARWALEQRETSLNAQQRSILEVWLQKSAGHATVNNYALTSGVKFCPELVRDAALNWIRTRPRDFQTHYLIVAWLKQGLPIEPIASSIERWATKFSNKPNLSFVVKAWLDADGDKEVLRAHIEAWLVRHTTDAEARFVYKSWLDAGGDKELVKDSIAAWLVGHATDAEADFVYKGWLNAGGDKELVKDSIAAWLVRHATDAEARFVYKSWLDAGGDKELVKDSIAAWLVRHATDAEAQFVYKSWLDAGGDKDLVKDSIVVWLVRHKADAEAQFVYRAWLDAGSDKELIQESLMAWLGEYGAGADADFVYNAWLQKGGSFPVIRSQVIEWLRRNYEREEAVFLTKYLAKQPDIPVETVRDILNWCRKFPANEDAFWRLTQLRKHLLREEIAEEVCVASETILNQRFSTNIKLTLLDTSQISTLLSYLIESPALREGELRNRVDEILLRWLRHPASFGDDPKPHKNIQRRSYVSRVIELIKSGALSVVEDRGALERFMQWVNNWESERKSNLRPAIGYLEWKYPAQGLWDIIKFEDVGSAPLPDGASSDSFAE